MDTHGLSQISHLMTIKTLKHSSLHPPISSFSHLHSGLIFSTEAYT